ncbi:hypothetical protein OAB57_04000, partial [Bacteriovoracaceae bacterium]|nr:hypothetical protein [Bacteriovoracaceae bacterium]
VTAALEELVRMVVSDKKYGINIKEENVIGVTMLLADDKGDLTTSRFKMKQNLYNKKDILNRTLTGTIVSPATWYIGKLAAIKEYIHFYDRPLLVAGDSPNDHHMLFYANVASKGKRIFVRRKESYYKKTLNEIQRRVILKSEFGKKGLVSDNVQKGWIFPTPKELGVRP